MTMHEFSRTRAVPMGSVAIFTLVSSFERAVARVAAWRRSRATARELSRLTPEQLDDIGLTRADIETVARETSEI